MNLNDKLDSFELGTAAICLDRRIVIPDMTECVLSNPAETHSGLQYPRQLQETILQTLLTGDSVLIPNWVALVEYAYMVFSALMIIILFSAAYLE